MISSIDINCDMGESYGHFKVGQDSAIMPHISSCNIACGFHGGDPLTLLKTLELADAFDLTIGAHPSFHDLQGFGRTFIHISPENLLSDLCYQISALMGMAQYVGTSISYIKPHGAMYGWINDHELPAEILVQLASKFGLAIMGKPGSKLACFADLGNVVYIREGFIDRRYLLDGNLQSRNEEGAVFHHSDEVITQVTDILMFQEVTTSEGSTIPIQVDSLCIHGDHPNSPEIAHKVHHRLKELGIAMKSSFS